mmetsp:Transcript_119275/g.210903  ORF Transcript_119275/g.210903 Transcript_119275/m.210903 type:complete len:161 (-) Transcript_119275:28-510(-)
MRVLAILLACLACTGHARRVLMTNQGPVNHGGLSEQSKAPTPRASFQSLLLHMTRLRGGSIMKDYYGSYGIRGWLYGSPHSPAINYDYDRLYARYRGGHGGLYGGYRGGYAGYSGYGGIYPRSYGYGYGGGYGGYGNWLFRGGYGGYGPWGYGGYGGWWW